MTTVTDTEPAVMPASLPADRQAVLTDIGRRLDHLPIGPVHRRVVVAIGLGLFFEVYEIFLSSSIATALSTNHGVDGTSLELLLASTFFGMFVGAAVFGRIADRVGRRRAFLLNRLPASTGRLLLHGPEDIGLHSICAVVTAEFLEHQRSIGNEFRHRYLNIGSLASSRVIAGA